MPAPYLTKNLWPDFTLAETTYSFAHLAEQYLTVVDSAGQERRIIATFTDHVFTRDRLTSDVIEHAFPGCSRGVGFVCSERHALSLQLPTLLPNICSSKVWNLTGADRYAQVPVVTHEDEEALYAIIFTLDKVKGLPFHLHLMVRSAYLCREKAPDTFGEVKFKHLVRLRLENKHPARVYSAGRKKPIMP
ncbi:hypothetical protein [Rhizobium sp. RHZ01]|uniref:hypothetical protein n=1 Tax=Rhizobium sp. RHZ01 TaxID=2769304 RepID=UPI00177BF9BF|nr:hypothetical protein [Rhizobium sp. RHZ01]MBD9447436.1 hypothetical protein [Rhizobium sp. RHZ01]